MPNPLKRAVHYLPWVGGLGCAMLLLFILMRPGGGDQRDQKLEPPKESTARVEVAELPKEPEESKSEEMANTTPQVVSANQPATQQADPRESLNDKSDSAEKSAPESLGGGPADTVKMVGAAEDKSEAKDETHLVVREPQEKKVIPPPPTAKVMQIRQEKPMKIKKVLASEKGSKGTINVQPPAVKEAIAAKNQLSVDQLLQKRMAAGAAWTKKGKEDAYTMQLMALTDKNAEDNLKKMLSQPQYRQESGNFFVFKKSAASTIVFVFYGEYPSLAMAREAQDSLPPFLVIHQPYPISIKGALAKVKK